MVALVQSCNRLWFLKMLGCITIKTMKVLHYCKSYHHMQGTVRYELAFICDKQPKVERYRTTDSGLVKVHGQKYAGTGRDYPY